MEKHVQNFKRNESDNLLQAGTKYPVTTHFKYHISLIGIFFPFDKLMFG